MKRGLVPAMNEPLLLRFNHSFIHAFTQWSLSRFTTNDQKNKLDYKPIPIKTLLAILLLCFLRYSIAQEAIQKHYQFEVELGTDNDFLVLLAESDRYYTYGINASFRWRNEKPIFLDKLFKKKTGYFQYLGLNIEAYTPDYERENTETDRPYAGFSYAELGVTYGFSSSFLRLGVDVGILGPASKAGDIQNWFHETITGDPTLDWSNQIENQFGFNLRGSYARTFYARKSFDVYGVVDVSLGNIFAYVNPGINLRWGIFNPLAETASFQNSILASMSNKEIFMDAGIALKFSGFNATIQGDKIEEFNFLDSEFINNQFLNGHIGGYYANDKLTIGVRYLYSSGEITDNHSQQYIMLTGAFRF